jgi:hypothetical protein
LKSGGSEMMCVLSKLEGNEKDCGVAWKWKLGPPRGQGPVKEIQEWAAEKQKKYDKRLTNRVVKSGM